jgi:YtxH-like protein
MAIPSISKEDILDALGIERSGGWFGPAAAAFGIGLVVGAAAALLLAPKSGEELREDLSKKMREMREKPMETPRTTV